MVNGYYSFYFHLGLTTITTAYIDRYVFFISIVGLMRANMDDADPTVGLVNLKTIFPTALSVDNANK